MLLRCAFIVICTCVYVPSSNKMFFFCFEFLFQCIFENDAICFTILYFDIFTFCLHDLTSTCFLNKTSIIIKKWGEKRRNEKIREEMRRKTAALCYVLSNLIVLFRIFCVTITTNSKSCLYVR